MAKRPTSDGCPGRPPLDTSTTTPKKMRSHSRPSKPWRSPKRGRQLSLPVHSMSCSPPISTNPKSRKRFELGKALRWTDYPREVLNLLTIGGARQRRPRPALPGACEAPPVHRGRSASDSTLCWISETLGDVDEAPGRLIAHSELGFDS